MKKIKITLSPSSSRGDAMSISRAIKELEKYRDSLMDKNELFVKRLADIGVNAAMLTLSSKGQGDAERSASFSVSFNTSDGLTEGTISITSKPHVNKDGRVFYPHLAWEFGAGNYFNPTGNPKAGEFGLGPGTFPDQTHVPEPGFWYYRDEHGDAIRSYGTQATMPMFTASKTIIEEIENIAKEVFQTN